VLESLEGFDEAMPAPAGEDTDLALRAKRLGARQVGVPNAVVYHAVEAFTLAQMIRLNWKWQHLVYVFQKHPELREQLTLGVFWRESHAEVAAALAGALLARRSPAALLLAGPYLRRGLRRRGSGRRKRIASAAELPGRFVVDVAELVTMARGSVRYRSLIL
jgi:GT2 family glycosyltransferase